MRKRAGGDFILVLELKLSSGAGWLAGLARLSQSWEILPAGVSSLPSLPPPRTLPANTELELTFEKIETKNNVNYERQAQASSESDIQWTGWHFINNFI